MTVTRDESTPDEGGTPGLAGPIGRADSPMLWGGRIAGAALLVWMGWIHLHLWSEGYKHVGTVGPLLILQFVAAIALALLLLGVSRRGPLAAVAAAGVLLAVATLGALALSINDGLFGFTESWRAPFTHVSVGIELAAAVVLLATAAGAASGRQAVTASGRQAGDRPQDDGE